MKSDRTLFATAAMGTRFEIVIEARETPSVRAAGEQAITEILRLHRLLSRFSSDSLISHINRRASFESVRVDADTFTLLRDAQTVWRASHGSFDPARGSGMDAVVLDDTQRTVAFERDGVTLDLGGIAKGHAVGRAADILRENGITRAFVHGGTSSVATIGAPCDDERGWRVMLAPALQHEIILHDEAMATSSASLRDHIVDPATGEYTRTTRISAVIGPCARLADAWSTAAAVMCARPDALGNEWRSIIE